MPSNKHLPITGASTTVAKPHVCLLEQACLGHCQPLWQREGQPWRGLCLAMKCSSSKCPASLPLRTHWPGLVTSPPPTTQGPGRASWFLGAHLQSEPVASLRLLCLSGLPTPSSISALPLDSPGVGDHSSPDGVLCPSTPVSVERPRRSVHAPEESSYRGLQGRKESSSPLSFLLFP